MHAVKADRRMTQRNNAPKLQMGNEVNICFAGLELMNVRFITLSINPWTTTSLTAGTLLLFKYMSIIFSSECRCKRVLSPAKKHVETE